MLITRECDYAVRIVRALAGGEKLCVNQICEKEELTPAFVYKILKKLEKGDLVKSFRGSNGGYALKKDIGQITLLDIYLAVEPEFYMIECMNPDKPCVRNQDEEGCKVHKELCKIQKTCSESLVPGRFVKLWRKSSQDLFFSKNILLIFVKKWTCLANRDIISIDFGERSGTLFITIFKEENNKWLER